MSNMQISRNDKIRLIGLIVGIAVPVIFAQFPVVAPLKANAWLSVGALLGAVVWIIAGTFRDYQAMLVMCCIFVATKTATFQVVFSPFSGAAWWVLFGALGIGVAAVESGFMKRAAFIMLKKLPSTYMGQCVAYVVSGMLLAPLVPSTSAKGSIMAPLARKTSEAMGLENHSKGAVGIYISMFVGYVVCALMYMTGSSVNVAVYGALPKGYEVTWMQWLICLAPWGIIVAVLMLIIVNKFYMPKGGCIVPKEQIEEQLAKIGPWTWKEKVVFALLMSCLVLWATESLTGINSTLVTIMAFVILFAANVVPASSFKNIPWDPLFFVGAFLCLPVVFANMGINAYLTAFLGPRVAPIMQNPMLLVLVIAILTYLIRLVFVSLSGTAVLILLVFGPLCPAYNIHPFVIACITYMSTTTWTVSYQHTVNIASLAAGGSDWVNQKDVTSGSLWFMLVNIIALLISVPYWHFLGMI